MRQIILLISMLVFACFAFAGTTLAYRPTAVKKPVVRSIKLAAFARAVVFR